MKLPIAHYGDEVLRKKAEPVEELTPEILRLIEDMIETMEAENGFGLAAPQIYKSPAIFIPPVPEIGLEGREGAGEIRVFINPKLSDPSEELWAATEGCLSIPMVYAEVTRPVSITLEYTNRDGERVTEQFSGWDARVIMHENDHLNGVLYIDRMSKKERQQLEPALRALKKETRARKK